eukprot:3402720-Pleurochrysis_carterae.AAC.1
MSAGVFTARRVDQSFDLLAFEAPMRATPTRARATPDARRRVLASASAHTRLHTRVCTHASAHT